MRALLVLVACGVATLGCFGTQVPPQKPAEDPMAGTKPVTKVDDPTKREDKPNERMANTFDKDQTMVSIHRGGRQAAECAKIHTDGPFGEFAVQVVLDPSGKVKDAIVPPPLAGTPIGKCVETAFEHEIIPPWKGHEETLEGKVTLVKPDAPPAAPDPKKK